MADNREGKRPEASVDFVVDENASPVELRDESRIGPASDAERTIGATGPTNWWRIGLAALAIVIAILLVLQLLGGNPGTDVQPGTPVAEPQTSPG